MKISIVGGGLSGWLTSLYAKKIFPEHDIVVIESSEVGILGAGEGSVPSLINLFKFLDIDVHKLFSDTQSTFKNGIRYINWSSTNPDYFHGFDPGFRKRDLSHFAYKTHYYTEPQNYPLYLENIYRNDNIDNFNFMSRLSRENKIPIIKSDNSQVSNWAIHFDAGLIAKFMKNIAVSRGVIHKDAKVSGFSNDESGNVKYIIFDDGTFNETDFVFDCTGLHRLIIGKHFSTKWNSFSEYLPAKRAVPFFIYDQPPFPHTGALAMDYGWMWQIPLQHRIGAGYVFDSDFINEDQAVAEIEGKLGFKIEVPRTFKIVPGFYERQWVNNVVAIGLSASFVEPLEANSIWMFTRNLERLFSDRSNILNPNKDKADLFNAMAARDAEDVRDFIFLHYVTDKKSNNFWQDFTKNNRVPDHISELLKISKSRPPYEYEIMGHAKMYWDSYYQIMYGNGIISKEVAEKYYHDNYLDRELPSVYNLLIENQKDFVKQCYSMSEYINIIKENYA